VDALAALLRLAGNVVYTAHDDIEAIDATQRYHPDVVLLDIGMPN
jgi:CheY-like chemotaxis protein